MPREFRPKHSSLSMVSRERSEPQRITFEKTGRGSRSAHRRSMRMGYTSLYTRGVLNATKIRYTERRWRVYIRGAFRYELLCLALPLLLVHMVLAAWALFLLLGWSPYRGGLIVATMLAGHECKCKLPRMYISLSRVWGGLQRESFSRSVGRMYG